MEARDVHGRHPNGDKTGIVYAEDKRALTVVCAPPPDPTGVTGISAADLSSRESQSE